MFQCTPKRVIKTGIHSLLDADGSVPVLVGHLDEEFDFLIRQLVSQTPHNLRELGRRHLKAEPKQTIQEGYQNLYRVLLRGTRINRNYVRHTNLPGVYVYLFLRSVFGPIYYAPP